MEDWMKDPRDPSREMIRETRLAAGLTQTKAAELVNASLRAWQDWEGGQRRMDFATWYLFKAKLERHTPEDFVASENDEPNFGVDKSRKVRKGSERLILRDDFVNLQTTEGFEVRVRVTLDRSDGLLAGVFQGVVNGFPNATADVDAKGRFAIGEPAVFLESQVAFIHLRNDAHFEA